MPVYEYFQDLKCTVWERKFFNVEAVTEAEADEVARQCARDNISMCVDERILHFEEDETLYDTIELFPLEENHGSATIEVFKLQSRYKSEHLADNSSANHVDHE